MAEKVSSPLAKKSNIWYEHRYELLIFAILSFEFVTMIPPQEKLSQYITTHYVLSYEFGFGARCLVGTLVSFFSDYITFKLIYTIAIISAAVLVVVLSLVIGKIIRKTDDENKNAIVILMMLFLFSPYSVTYLYGFHFARLDTYWVLLTVMSLVFLKNKILRWLIPLLCAAVVAIHQGYMTTYMPAVAIPLLYEMYKSGYKKKNILLFVLGCLSLGGMFLLCQFVKPNFDFSTARELGEYLKQRTETVIGVGQLNVEYFVEFKEWFVNVFRITESFALINFLALAGCSFPFFIIFGYIWKYSFKNSNDKMMKFIVFLCTVSPLLFFASALGAIDWDRWWASIMNTQFILIFYFVSSKEETVIVPLRKAGNYLKNHLLSLLLIAVMTNSLTYSKLLGLPSYTMDVQRYIDFFGANDVY